MRDIFLDEFKKREAKPGEDFLSQLVLARDGNDRLSESEMVGICHLTLIAGHDTTANSLALGTAQLADNPEARDFVRNNPDRIGDAVMEIMRLSAVSTSMARIATENFEWYGHQIQAGQIVLLMIVGANRDPAVFPDPLRLDFTRPQIDNMTFAPGLHHCVGHFMAKMQLSEFFPALLDRFETVELLDERFQFGAGISFRGPEHLNMRFIPR
jgi:cytochrome P450